MLRVVFRGYGGENFKGRPKWYSKELAFASVLRATEYAFAELGDRVSVTFVNNGPMPPHMAKQMYNFYDDVVLLAAPDVGPRAVEVHQVPGGPVGMRESYRYALNLPDLLEWADDDVVVYIEDDYLLTREALTALFGAAQGIPEAGYFAPAHARPTDFDDAEQMAFYSIPPWWQPAPDREVNGRTWINILGVTSTFAARVSALRRDKDIFLLCQKPFRRRWYDHETAMIYQGVTPYRGKGYLAGMPGDFVPGARGVARAVVLLPFRFAANARAAKQRLTGQLRYLYAPSPVEAMHLETACMFDHDRWANEAAKTATWAAARDYQLPERSRVPVGSE